MATSQGQDILWCHLCPDPVEHHCNHCRVNLCSNCILKHIKDKSKRHEIVEFMNKRTPFGFPQCNVHDNALCDMYCNDCQVTVCKQCVTNAHKEHDLSDTESVAENLKACLEADIAQLKKIIKK